MKTLQPEEKEALEKCDSILEGIQDYLRGATDVKEIRRLIRLRLESGKPQDSVREELNAAAQKFMEGMANNE